MEGNIYILVLVRKRKKLKKRAKKSKIPLQRSISKSSYPVSNKELRMAERWDHMPRAASGVPDTTVSGFMYVLVTDFMNVQSREPTMQTSLRVYVRPRGSTPVSLLFLLLF